MGFFSRRPTVLVPPPPMNELDVALAAKAFLDAGPQDPYDPYVMGAIHKFSWNYMSVFAIELPLQDGHKPMVRRALAIFTAQHNSALCC